MTDWWSYFAARGYAKLAARPRGAPALHELPGEVRLLGSSPPWQVLPCAVLRLPPTRAPITARTLRDYERAHGPIPDGYLLLLETRWASAPPPKAGDAGAPRAASGAGADTALRGPGLAADGLQHLLQRAPQLLGVGIDAPALDLQAAQGAPARTILLQRKKLVVEALGDLALLNAAGTRLLVVRGARRAHLIALLP